MALTFLSSLVSVVLVVSLVSWLSVGTFWLSHSRIRLEVEQEAECSLTLLVITGITVFLSWTGLLSGLIMNSHLYLRSRVKLEIIQGSFTEFGAEYNFVIVAEEVTFP